MGSVDSLIDLTARINNDDSLKYSDSNSYVVQRGSSDPDVVFMGEAPGEEEDAVGAPFVGRAGHLLDEWIDELDLHEEEYAICNVVKTKPPENRKPTRKEIGKHAKYTQEQLDILDPELVVTLGKTAMQFFFPDREKILDYVGKSYEKDEQEVFVLPHPAFCLRQESYDMEPHLLTLAMKLREGLESE